MGSGWRTGGVERPGDDLVRAFRRLVRAVGRLEARATAEAGLARAQAHALLAVAAMGRPAMTMVARELGLAPSTVTRALDPLVRGGLLKRESAPDDRRVVVVALTAAGRQAVERLESALDLAYARVTAGAGPGSQKRFAAAARELAAAIERVRADERGPDVQAGRPRPPRRAARQPAAAAGASRAALRRP
jgi:DNA-binding MarR family transcriptional regulator